MADTNENTEQPLLPEAAPSTETLPEIVEQPAVVAEPVREATPVTTHVVLRRAPSAAWAVAAVFVAMIGSATFIVYTIVYSVPAKVIETGGNTATAAIEQAARIPDRLAAAFKPNVSVNTIVSSGIENVKHQSKLVVMTADVDVEIGKSSEKRVLWDSLKLGDTTVRLRVRDNKVQYVVPVQEFDKDDVTYRPEANCLMVTIPAPQLDSELVEVQSNPDAMDAETDVGWGRLDMFSGDFLLDEAKRELREAVLREGANPLLQEKAKTEAESAVRGLLKDWLPNLREDVELKVEFS